MKRILNSIAATLIVAMLSPAAQAAFAVEIFRGSEAIETLGEAMTLIGGTPDHTESTEVINFIDRHPRTTSRLYSDLQTAFPGGANNRFAMRVTADIEITDADTYTFGFDSDDGAELSINGAIVASDTTVHRARTTLGQISLGVGIHALELIYWESSGRATIELFAAQGAFAAFSAGDFNLIGDIANGGIATTTAPVPIPSSIVLLSGGLLGLFLKRRAAAPGTAGLSEAKA